jgi:hypothetical protein
MRTELNKQHKTLSYYKQKKTKVATNKENEREKLMIVPESFVVGRSMTPKLLGE